MRTLARLVLLLAVLSCRETQAQGIYVMYTYLLYIVHNYSRLLEQTHFFFCAGGDERKTNEEPDLSFESSVATR